MKMGMKRGARRCVHANRSPVIGLRIIWVHYLVNRRPALCTVETQSKKKHHAGDEGEQDRREGEGGDPRLNRKLDAPHQEEDQPRRYRLSRAKLDQEEEPRARRRGRHQQHRDGLSSAPVVERPSQVRQR